MSERLLDAATQARPASTPGNAPVLDVAGLKTFFFTRLGIIKAVDDLSFALRPRETLAIVG
jgi:ABC-type glutathione transport system ATPase component